MTPFDAATTWAPDGERFAGTATEDWMQGRATFGGLLAAGAVRLARDLEPERAVRTLDARFFEPVGPGPFTATREVLRAGRSVAHVQVDLYQRDRLCFRSVVCLAAPRPSDLQVDELIPPEPADLDRYPTLPYIEGLTPSFTRHVDFRIRRGMPFGGADRAEIDGWCRFSEGATGVEGIVGLLDTWPAPLLALTTRPVPASTVHWTAHLLTDRAPAPDAWCRYQARTLFAANGTSTFAATLWGPDGTPLAWSEQLAAVFDR